ncbi:MAG TPA: 50S ribosomal protein L10 [Candidatus Margulisiibacteriota bacterium]|nr:50S ribosomal protein L10 [Candidatus Margulisiibacteriota bacterium]
MNREEKAANVAALHERFKQAKVTLLATSQGLSVAKVQQLRRAVKQAGGEYKVAKNTFARRALKETAYAKLEALLEGPTGLVFGYADPVAVAKVLVKFAEENEKLSIKAGFLDDRVLEPAAVTALAKMPSREVLLAQLLGLLQAPAAQLLRTMQEPGARLVRLMGRVRDRLEKSE